MSFEVELKFPAAGLTDLRERLETLGVTWQAEQRQVDQYYAHPARNFAETDEALRVRSVNQDNVVTYKGPKVDTHTKTREELELPIESGETGAARFGQLLQKLGFRPVAVVAKSRIAGRLVYRDQEVEVAWDSVDDLGEFVELESTGEAEDLEATRTTLLQLASQLGLEQSERRGYLDLLLSQESGQR